MGSGKKEMTMQTTSFGRGVVIETPVAVEKKILDRVLPRQVVTLNAVDIAEASTAYDLAKMAEEDALCEFIAQMTPDTVAHLPAHLRTVWRHFHDQRAHARALRTRIPEKRFAVMDGEGLPMPRKPEPAHAQANEVLVDLQQQSLPPHLAPLPVDLTPLAPEDIDKILADRPPPQNIE
jgi:hypothetical protein